MLTAFCTTALTRHCTAQRLHIHTSQIIMHPCKQTRPSRNTARRADLRSVIKQGSAYKAEPPPLLNYACGLSNQSPCMVLYTLSCCFLELCKLIMELWQSKHFELFKSLLSLPYIYQWKKWIRVDMFFLWLCPPLAFSSEPLKHSMRIITQCLSRKWQFF